MSEKETLKTEAGILASTLEVRTKEFNEKFEKITADLKTQLNDMKTYNVMLQSVPTKLNKQLEETIPKVAIELDKINTKRIRVFFVDLMPSSQVMIRFPTLDHLVSRFESHIPFDSIITDRQLLFIFSGLATPREMLQLQKLSDLIQNR